MLVARPFCPVFVEEKSVCLFAKESEKEGGRAVCAALLFGRYISLLFELTKWMDGLSSLLVMSSATDFEKSLLVI